MILDSNIVIYAALPGYDKLREYLKQKELIVSSITKLEVLGYHKLSKDEIDFFTHFFNNIIVVPVNNRIINQAIKLRQKQKITLGDSLIAATSIVYKQDLLTYNTNDFKHINQLSLIASNNILP